MIQKIKNFILDVLFPVECLGCKREGELICSDCFSAIKLSQNQFCPSCCQKSNSGLPCEKCKDNSFLDRLVVCADYNDPLISKSIKDLKYRFIEDYGKHLGNLMAKYIFLKEPGFEMSSFLITTVPLHKKRYLERNFNQSQLIAERFCQALNLKSPVDILQRKRYTINQASLNKKDRLKNIKDAFICLVPVNRRKVLIIDDVFTTGATLQECAKVLKQNGAEQVIGLVIAHEN